jgi:hypothetical protein
MRPDSFLLFSVPCRRNWRSTISYAAGIALITGLAGAPALGQATLSPDKVLVSCTVGHCSPAKTTLTNVGATTVTITSITLTGKNPGDFTQTNNCGTELRPGASCSFSIVTGAGPGTFTIELVVNDNAPNSPQIAYVRFVIKD